jgi:hypothetical protein
VCAPLNSSQSRTQVTQGLQQRTPEAAIFEDFLGFFSKGTTNGISHNECRSNFQQSDLAVSAFARFFFLRAIRFKVVEWLSKDLGGLGSRFGLRNGRNATTSSSVFCKALGTPSKTLDCSTSLQCTTMQRKTYRRPYFPTDVRLEGFGRRLQPNSKGAFPASTKKKNHVKSENLSFRGPGRHPCVSLRTLITHAECCPISATLKVPLSRCNSLHE